MNGLWTPDGARPDPTVLSDGLSTIIDLYDSDLLVIEQVINKLMESAGTKRDVQGYVDEANERFGLAGYLVTVNMFEVTGPGPLPIGTFVPDIIIRARVTPEEFDRERMQWEVQHDILGIDDNPGAVQSDGSVKSPTHTTSFTDKP